MHREAIYYSALMGDTDAVLVAVDGSGVMRWVSPEVRDILGYQPEAVVGRPVTAFLAPRETESGMRKLGDLLRNPGATLRTVHRVRHADGSYRTMVMVGRDLRKVPEVEAIVIQLRDITEQNQVIEALAENRARLEEAYRIAGLGWWQLDVQTGQVQLSDRLLELTGYERLSADNWSELRHILVHPDDLQRVEQALSPNRAVGSPTSVEHRIVRADGSIGHWLVHAQAFSDRAGSRLRLSGTVLDVTERRLAESEQFRTEKLEALDLLCAGITHDFNNLLAVIQGNISLVLEGAPDPADASLLADAELACRRAAQLSRQLSSYARSAEEPRLTEVQVAELVHEVVPLLLRGSRVRGELLAPDDLPRVHGAAAELSQVLQNLVLNAVAAMPEGGVLGVAAQEVTLPPDAPAVRLPPGPYVRLTVQDSGKGIAPEHLSRIFDPYFTTRPDGQGLGLATTHRIVRRHGGHISVQSAPGQGAVFHVYLPAVGPQPAQQESAAGDTLSLYFSANVRALLVDDDDLVRATGANLLTQLGCSVETACGSGEALEATREALVRGQAFHIAILDLTLPGDLSAPELLRNLSAVDPMIRGVISSGHQRHDAMVKYRRAGFRAALPKPYGLAQLRVALSDALAVDGSAAED